jgi:multidrug efflux system membrane fusion protein
MRKRTWVALGVAALALVGAGIVLRDHWSTERAAAQGSPRAGRVVPVTTAKVVKGPVAVRLEALGSVTTMASVAIKPRIDTEIVGVHFSDGARVKRGDVLFTLDSRVIEALIQQAEGNIARDQAQIEGADRDVRRYTELVAKAATPVINLENAKTQAATFRGTLKADQAALENLKVQLSYCTIRAPISGRISMANVKVGNFVRQADTVPLATINQIAPIYVSFTIPQRSLADVRQALAAETATVEAIVPGTNKRAAGQVTMIENTVDPATGMVTVRATMPNADELLWPGTLVNTRLTLRTIEALKVPAAALQLSQTGTFVFVVKDGTASVRPVTVDRTVDGETVISSGLKEGEVVVTDGQLLLSEGTRVSERNKVGS